MARSSHAIREMLVRDLQLGNTYVAIRHYLMLISCGGHLPDAVRSRCEDLVKGCQKDRLHQITVHVQDWRRWCSELPRSTAGSELRIGPPASRCPKR